MLECVADDGICYAVVGLRVSGQPNELRRPDASAADRHAVLQHDAMRRSPESARRNRDIVPSVAADECHILFPYRTRCRTLRLRIGAPAVGGTHRSRSTSQTCIRKCPVVSLIFRGARALENGAPCGFVQSRKYSGRNRRRRRHRSQDTVVQCVKRFETIAGARHGDEIQPSARFVCDLNGIRRAESGRDVAARDVKAGKRSESPLQRPERIDVSEVFDRTRRADRGRRARRDAACQRRNGYRSEPHADTVCESKHVVVSARERRTWSEFEASRTERCVESR